MSTAKLTNLNPSSAVQPDFWFDKALSLSDLWKANQEEIKKLNVMVEKMDLEVKEVELLINTEDQVLNFFTQKKLMIVYDLLGRIDDLFVRVEYVDEKSKNILLGEIDYRIGVLKETLDDLKISEILARKGMTTLGSIV